MKPKMKRINLAQMQARCFATIAAFDKEPGFQKFSSSTGIHLFKDNGAKVLAVAHLDTVQSSNHFYELMVGGKRWVLNPKLDDRLGAYVILDYLPSYGLEYDILLTEGEESGRSTAGDFKPPEGRVYNWMFQFDRMGEDVVSYDYRNKELDEHLERHGFKTALGSFSDICKLEDLGCKGFNVGCGYENYHSLWAIADLGILKRQMLRFISFFWEMKDIHLPHVKNVWGGTAQGYWEGEYWKRGNGHGGHKHRGRKYKWDKDKKTLIEYDEPAVVDIEAAPSDIEATQPLEPVGPSDKDQHSRCALCNERASALTYLMGCFFCDNCMKELRDTKDGQRISRCEACHAPDLVEFYHGSWYCASCLVWAKEVIEGKGDVVAPEN